MSEFLIVTQSQDAAMALSASTSMTTAPGRLRAFISVIFAVPERPLSGKADVQILDFEKSLRNDRYAHGSGHWDDRVLNYRY